MEFTRMNVVQLMLKFLTAKYYLSPDDISETFKNYMSIPQGADPGDYMRVTIQFYKDNKSPRK